MLAAVRRHLDARRAVRGGARRTRSRTGPTRSRCRRCRTSARRTAGSTRRTPIAVRRADGGLRDRAQPPGGVALGRDHGGALDDRARLGDARRARGRGRGRGLRAAAAAAAWPPTPDYVGSDVVLLEARMSALRVCSLYPELMNIYADRGNIAVLRARCEWRGIGFELGAASMREPVDPDAWDLFYMGGGQDRDQAAVARGHGRDEARRAPRRGGARRGRAGRVRRLPAARAQLRDGRRGAAGRRARGPAHRARAGPAPDRQLRDRGRPRRRAAHDRRASRTTAGAPTSGRASSRSAAC